MVDTADLQKTTANSVHSFRFGKQMDPGNDTRVAYDKMHCEKSDRRHQGKHFQTKLFVRVLTFKRLQLIFEYNGSDKDFMDRFMLEMSLFIQSTAHLSEREKYELVVDPDPGETANFLHWIHLFQFFILISVGVIELEEVLDVECL